jgi:hypothetical protein
MGVAARQRVEAEFSLTKAIARYQSLYLRLGAAVASGPIPARSLRRKSHARMTIVP